VEIPTMLTKELVISIASCLGWSAARDVEVIQHRCEHEGISFLTITLPLLSDALERGLEEGRFTCPTNFSRHGTLPRFLGGLFNRVFNSSGVLLNEPDVECISAIRQICRFQKKLKIGCSASREASAVIRYKQVEEELFHASRDIATRDDALLDAISRRVWSQVFPEVDPLDLVSRHGPGATSDRLTANSRQTITYWYDRFEESFPKDLHAFHNYGSWVDSVGDDPESSIRELGVLEEIPVRVVFVPKTLTSPRVIAIEPSSMQYVQQSLLSYMTKGIESHWFTNMSIRFSDQTVNQLLAKSSSIDRSLATIDMSDASDRVSLALVNRIFHSSGISQYLQDARSLSADLPDGTNVVLSKFASMGSAICFPVEACVFYTLILTALHRADGTRPSTRSILRYSRMIDVYGDDIIIPVDYVDSVVAYLESYALKVNQNKSFRFSQFRESCGGDFYNGIDVKPIYCRSLFSDPTAWTPADVMSAVSLSNQLYEAGWWRVCQVVRSLVEVAVRSRVPRCRFPGSGVYFSSFLFDTMCRYDSRLHAYVQKRLVYSPSEKLDRISSTAGLFNKAFSPKRRQTSAETHFVVPDDLPIVKYDSSVKRGVFKPKRQWVTVM
jgi:hypothetical protein